MEANCGICEEVLGDRPHTELLCHHFFHTECILTNIATGMNHDILLDLHCAQCQEAVFPQNMQEQEDQETHSVDSYRSDNDVDRLYDTNEVFRKDVKKFAEVLRERSKPRTAFRKLCAAKKKELAPRYKQIKDHIKSLFNVNKDTIVQTEEYKVYKKAEGKSTRFLHSICRNYNLRSRDIRRLSRRPGLRSLVYRSYSRDQPTYIIRRAIRLRLPYY